MGLFSFIFGRRPRKQNTNGYWQTLTAYTPTFRNWRDDLYESELVRSAIDARARHISKLRVEVIGAAEPRLKTQLKQGPNSFMTWGQFLYRLSTILDMQNTAFIVPVIDEGGNTVGIYPVLPSSCEIVNYEDEPYLRYRFRTGEFAAISIMECGIMTKFQYRDDFFGEPNSALNETMQLISIQNQGVQEAIKNSATYRFMAQLNNFSKTEDLKKERERFSAENFSAESHAGGLLLFPNTYSNIQQIQSKAYTIDADTLSIIQNNVYSYFGVNDKILQNIATGDEWNSFYEGAIEPFSIQFSDVVTRMLYTPSEIAHGSFIQATANRLQYMSNTDKLNVSAQMADRGIMSINEIRDIWNLTPVEGGDIRILRGEYKDSTDVNDKTGTVSATEIPQQGTTPTTGVTNNGN